MKKFAIVVHFTLAALILTLTSPPAESANSKAADLVVFDFFHQYIDYATPSDMPMHHRIATAVNAAADLAAELGSDIDAPTLMQSVRFPSVFAPASDTTYTWNGTAWVPDARTTYTYNGDKKNTVMSETWTGTEWQKSSNLIYTYNGNNLSSYRLQNWSGTAWEDAFRYSITYTGALPVETIAEFWDSGVWSNLSRSVNAYDGSSRLVTITSYNWFDPDWIEAAKTTNTYDGAGDLTLTLSQQWLGGIYMNQVQTSYVYDGNHRPTSATTQIWNSGLSVWQNQSLSEYVYNGFGNQTLDRLSSWNGAAWTLTDVDTFKYNGSNQNIQGVYWDVTADELTRDDLSYDGSGNLVEVISYILSGSWQPTDRYVWVYTSVAVKVDEASLPGDFVLLQNHPNPFNPTTTIRYSLARPQLVQIEVFNILGQLVRTLENSNQGVGTYETTWNGADTNGREVASGVYFYRLKAGDFVQTRKMVLSR